MVDRISDLPTELIHEILMAIPIRDAVKTSMLSRPWRYKWASVPDLVFDTRSQSTLLVPDEERGQASSKLVNFVSKVLFLHSGTVISKFELNNFLEHGCLDVDDWILTLSRKSLNLLVLDFSSSTDPYRVPLCLFACKAMTNLKLKFCTLNIPSDYKGFTYLIKLTLHRVSVTNEAFERLVLQLPNLLLLRTWYCTHLSSFNIDAPNLQKLWIVGACDVLRIRNTPRIKSVRLHKWLPDLGDICINLKEVQGLNVVKRISFHHPFVECSLTDISSGRLGVAYKYLHYARLHINFDDSKQILAILSLCESSPSLRILRIKATWDRPSALLYDECLWKTRLEKQGELLLELCSVSFVGFKGVEHDMGFARYILLNARRLEIFHIYLNDNTSTEEVANKVLHIERASSKANVILEGREDNKSALLE